MVSVMKASSYVTLGSCYQTLSRSSLYIKGLISWNSRELDEAVLIGQSLAAGIQYEENFFTSSPTGQLLMQA